MKNPLRELLDIGNNIVLNRTLIKIFGLEATAYLGELISIDRLHDEEEFKISRERIEEHTSLSSYKQRQAEAILVKKNVLIVKKKGVPATNHYQVNYDVIFQLLKNLTTSRKKIKQQVVKNFNDYNNISSNISSNINNININNINLDSKAVSANADADRTFKNSSLKENKKEINSLKAKNKTKDKKSTRRQPNPLVQYFFDAIRAELGYIPSGSEKLKRRIVATMVKLLEKRNKKGEVKKGRNFLSDDTKTNINMFLQKYAKAYEPKFRARNIYKLYEAVKFYVENLGEVRPDRAIDKRNDYIPEEKFRQEFKARKVDTYKEHETEINKRGGGPMKAGDILGDINILK